MNFSIKEFFSKCDQIPRELWNIANQVGVPEQFYQSKVLPGLISWNRTECKLLENHLISLTSSYLPFPYKNDHPSCFTPPQMQPSSYCPLFLM